MEAETAYMVYHTGIKQLLSTEGQATAIRLHELFMRRWAARPTPADIECCLALMVEAGEVEQCGTSPGQTLEIRSPGAGAISQSTSGDQPLYCLKTQ